MIILDMEDKFLSFLDSSIGIPIGSIIAIVIGGVALIYAAILSFKKVRLTYHSYILDMKKKEKDNEELHESIKEVATSIATIQTKISDLSISNQEERETMNQKLDEVWNAIVGIKKDSKEGDKILEQQLKNTESGMDQLNLKLSSLDEKTTLLLNSDKEGIKAFITDKYYQAVKDGYIEIHVLQSLEKRYKDYLKENGNTFVGTLMAKMRNMPNELSK